MREEEIEARRSSPHTHDINKSEEIDDTVDAENYSIEIPGIEANTDFNIDDAT